MKRGDEDEQARPPWTRERERVRGEEEEEEGNGAYLTSVIRKECRDL